MAIKMDELQLYEKELSRQYVFQCGVFQIAVCQSELPNGAIAERDIVCHVGGVCIVPIDKEKNVLLVKQYRYGAGSLLLELPAGKLEPNEEILEAAIRELEEETGYHANHMQSLGFCYSSPAISSEKIYLYLATDLALGKQNPDADEFLCVEKYPLSELVDMVMDGKITDAKTQIGILKAANIVNNSL